VGTITFCRSACSEREPAPAPSALVPALPEAVREDVKALGLALGFPVSAEAFLACSSE
jgi:hypothetical protein